jgi:hypothetical protein
VNNVDQLIRSLIDSNRQATQGEQQQIVAYVAQASISSRLVKINQWLRQEMQARGVQIPCGRLPSAELHVLKRIHFDGQWPPGTTVAQFAADLHQAVQHPDIQLWTYRWLGESFAGFLAPSHVHNVPNPEAFIFVAYSADHGTIKTGFQASGPDSIFTDAFENLIRHR